MSEKDLAPPPDPQDPLLTPREQELRREVRTLRERSDRLVKASSHAARPKELLGRFPPVAPPHPPGNGEPDRDRA